VLLHQATAQVLASVVLVDREQLAPGDIALAQLRVDRRTPIGPLPNDRFIVRGFAASAGTGATLGGGRVIRVLAPKARRGEQHARLVAQLVEAKLDRRIALLVEGARAAGMTTDDLVRRLGLPPAALTIPLATMTASGELLRAGEHYLHATVVAELEQAVMTLLASPDGLAREDLRTRLPPALAVRAYDSILSGLERRGLVLAAADRVARAAHARGLALTASEAAVLAALDTSGLEPPRPKELPAQLQISDAQVKSAVDRLVANKLAVKIKPDLVMHSRVVDELRTRLIAHLTAHATIDAQQWKDLTGASRKFTIPLAEYFDTEKLTLRIGDVRRLRAGPQKK
jgi:selenocysteine-specific elongation factor